MNHPLPFLDEFNGNNTTLAQYNNDYHIMAGEIYVATDHAYTLNGYGAWALYTGLSQDNTCTSMDFRSDGWVRIALRTTPDDAQDDIIDLVDGSWWRYMHNFVWVETGQLGSLSFDRFSPTIHNLKACADGTNLTAYIDGQLFFSAQSTNTGGYSGFGAYQPTTYLDNFKIEAVNHLPSVGTISTSVNPVQVNTAITASATFTDADTTNTHTASWDWGDGNTTTGTVTENNGSGTVSDNHTYTAPGVYQITLTVTDNNGGPGTAVYQYEAAYVPTPQGLFTGVRLFNSPAGAYSADLSLTGQVQFGIVAKYSGSAPTANVSMSFKAANLSFVATAVNTLVIANDKATLRGTGTLNGSGNYTFLATGIDGQSTGGNTIRFQIKDASGNVVYDTQPGASDVTNPTTAVTGQVIVH